MGVAAAVALAAVSAAAFSSFRLVAAGHFILFMEIIFLARLEVELRQMSEVYSFSFPSAQTSRIARSSARDRGNLFGR